MKSVYSLKERLSEEGTLIVQNERGFIMEAEFKWNAPAAEADITAYEREKNITLPGSYKDFLKLANGAVLFGDKKYGQWGCRIYGTTGLSAINEEVRSWLQLPDTWLVFAAWLGDRDLLIFDMDKYASGDKNYIIDGDECDTEDEFGYIKGGFETWLDRLIVAQGAKYWRW